MARDVNTNRGPLIQPSGSTAAMRNWNRVLLTSFAASSIVVGCAMTDDLSDRDADNARSRLACELLTEEPEELEGCAEVAPDGDAAALVSREGESAGHKCGTAHPSWTDRDLIEAEVEAHRQTV